MTNKEERMKKHQPGMEMSSPIQAEQSLPTANNTQENDVHIFTPLTLNEVLETPELDFLTDNLIVRNTVNTFFAPAKTGKTYLCLNYAMCMVKNTPFIGMETHLKRNIGYLNLDMFRAGFNDRVKQVMRGFDANQTPEQMADVFSRLKIIDNECIRSVRGHTPNFYTKEYLNDLQYFILDNDIEFLFIDTFSRIRAGSKENDNDDMGITLQNAEEFFSPLNCGCLFIHHTGKDGTIRGAQAIIDNSEFVFGLRKVNNSNKHLQLFSETPRYTDTFELDVYPTFKQRTNEYGSSFADSYFLSAMSPDDDNKNILDYLNSIGNSWVSARDICLHAGGNYKVNSLKVTEMFNKGILERVRSGRGFNYRKKTDL